MGSAIATRGALRYGDFYGGFLWRRYAEFTWRSSRATAGGHARLPPSSALSQRLRARRPPARRGAGPPNLAYFEGFIAAAADGRHARAGRSAVLTARVPLRSEPHLLHHPLRHYIGRIAEYVLLLCRSATSPTARASAQTASWNNLPSPSYELHPKPSISSSARSLRSETRG